MKRKKMAIMVEQLYGGGMEHVAAQLSNMLNGKYEIFLFVVNYNKKKTYSHSGKIEIIPNMRTVIGKGVMREGLSYLRAAYAVRKLKIKHKIDITISIAPEMNVINFLSGIREKKIFTIHSCTSERKDVSSLSYRKMMIKLCNLSDKTITVSNWCKRDLINVYGIDKQKVQTIYNPIEDIKGKDCGTKENIVLVVGRLHDVKQQWHIIRAFQELLKKCQDAQLWIVGNGSNRKYLQNLVKGLKLESRVKFWGHIENMEEIYKKGKVMVFASASEAFPCSILESISYGIPVVAADCPGGIREIIAPNQKLNRKIQGLCFVKGGILTPRLDGNKYSALAEITYEEKMLAEGIEYLLLEEKQYELCSEKCLKIAERYLKERIGLQWEKCIAEVLNEKQII